MKKLVLFDIDGTLIRSDSELTRLHIESYAFAFKKIYGLDASLHDIIEHSGRTDMQNIREVLRKKGVDDGTISSRMDEMIRSMADYFRSNICKVDSTDDLIHGARECLDELQKDGSCVLGLVTGNPEKIAMSKLERLGIWDYFQVGGFGGSTEVRAELVKTAMAEAEQKLGVHVKKEEVYVVGDTKFDVQCAKENGVVSVAVSTGTYSESELRKYRPDHVIKNLLELPRLLKYYHPPITIEDLTEIFYNPDKVKKRVQYESWWQNIFSELEENNVEKIFSNLGEIQKISPLTKHTTNDYVIKSCKLFIEVTTINPPNTSSKISEDSTYIRTKVKTALEHLKKDIPSEFSDHYKGGVVYCSPEIVGLTDLWHKLADDIFVKGLSETSNGLDYVIFIPFPVSLNFQDSEELYPVIIWIKKDSLKPLLTKINVPHKINFIKLV